MSAPLFVPLPKAETIRLAWPTPNRALFTTPDRFFARTRVNPRYGMPGFTRDCGQRFHRGVDIAPVNLTATGRTTRVWFTDCATGRDYSSEEPTFVPHDDVFCVYEGRVVERVAFPESSDLGCHILIEHRWPRSGTRFFTLYAHLEEIRVAPAATLHSGQRLARMGQTSRSADARNWLAIAPHLHFEVWDEQRLPHDPLEFLKRFLPAPP